ncbi:serine/threonine-protein phosphatase 6 regulatory ankyrin repeat subunit B [Halyomorpha halys]|uniref:serine/threonine-protein phosphatase 6 regulatory ankyrin repeat subunit B n=1 Tax=Halyomorpha halys TaxID=286706 RepID=UPI0006D4CFF0|nr:ankyrin-2-like [Halyomorpha halys]
MLMKNGANTKIVPGNQSFTEMILESGNPDMLKVLVNSGASETALHIASGKGSLEMVKALVRHGADMDSQDNKGFSPLMTACADSNDYYDCFRMASMIWRINFETQSLITVLEILLPLQLKEETLTYGANTKIVPGNQSFTEMVLESGNPDMVKVLVNKESSLKSKDGDTKLHLLACSGNAKMLDAIKK